MMPLYSKAVELDVIERAKREGILESEHPAAINCIGRRGVIVNGKPHRMVSEMALDGSWIVELCWVHPFTKGEAKYGTGYVLRRRSVSSASIDWKRGHGPGSSCEWCGGLFEL